jgi:glycosidase
MPSAAHAYDVSAPAILQDFENSWQTISNRMPDIFAAGYGGVYTPPPGRADSGNQSVGYDVYDRFDLGSPGNPTLYGTQTGLKTMINAIHTAGKSSYVDLVWNQSGFSNNGNTSFEAAGGYPGFAVTLQNTDPTKPGYTTKYNDIDGDYHPGQGPGSTGDQNMRLAGLDDIAQEKNNSFIRQPTTAGDPNNIPAGTTPWNNRLANVPNAANAQYYPDKSLQPISVYDPTTGEQNIKIYPFNLNNPMAGDPVQEDALGYLMRYTQWMVQVMGADGFRIDAAKNMPSWVLNYYDRSVYRESSRFLLNGQQRDIFAFSEVYDSSTSLLNLYYRKDINHNDPGTVGGNRDVLDFPLFFAMQNNLSSNGTQNDWNNIVNASYDMTDDGLHNGSRGVTFVSSQDNGPPAMAKVAYAYTLMMPGNTLVYYNGHEFGTYSQRPFPQDAGTDSGETALGGAYGNTVSNLVDLRNRYGRGNYRQDFLEKENYAFERSGSSLVMLSNRGDAGYDSRTIDVTFAPGTRLVELTGNAHGSFADPNGDIPGLLVVNSDSSSPTGASVNVRFLRNSTYAKGGGSTYYTGDGFLVYGLPTPTGSLSLTNVAQVMHNNTPSTSDSNIQYENGTVRLSDIDVIKSNTFTLSLHTNITNLVDGYHDHDADGDQAQVKIDGGVDVTGSGLDTTPSDVTYGYQQFKTTFQPGYSANNGAGGDGNYSQTIDVSKLGQGYHYISVIAFRHNTNGSAPPVYNDWKQTIYVDTAPANSTILSFNDDQPGVNENRQLKVQSVDGLANNMHTFLDLPFGLADAQVIAMVNGNTQANQLDVNLWQHYYSGVTSGNHSATIVSFKPDGSATVQRFSEQQMPFLATSTIFGSGIGDLNNDGSINVTDINKLSTVVSSNNQQFNPAADVNGDGYVDLADTFLMGPVLSAHNVDNTTWSAFNNFIHGGYVTTGTYNVVGPNNVYEVTAGTTNVTAGGALTATYVRGNTLSIAGGGTATIRSNNNPNSGVSSVSNLTIAGGTDAWTGLLDLTNNDLLVESTAANRAGDLANIVNQLKQGQAGTGGITSSTGMDAGGHVGALGVILNDNGSGSPVYPTFDGLAADTNSILIKYTLLGDTNLDGNVNVGDLSNMAGNFGVTSGASWLQGDFNYDGQVNIVDLSDLAANFGDTLSSGSSASAVAAAATASLAAGGGTASVPEPSSLVSLVLAGIGLYARHRRRRHFVSSSSSSSSSSHSEGTPS